MSARIRRLRLGISPCPNDTFMFHGLLHGLVPAPGVELTTEFLDIEALNRRALSEPPHFDVTKISLPAVARRADEYAILSAGAALGRGCGPLVVRRAADAELRTLADLAGRSLAIPGENTTARLLFDVFGPEGVETTAMPFDRIMPAVAGGRFDAGLIIHESRFTFADHGLCELTDLGVEWENDTGLPLPLGVIAARRSLGREHFAAIDAALRASIELAFADPAASQDFVRGHAQEMDPEVCRRHIELYVNDYSIELGREGRAAIDELLRRARSKGRLPAGAPPWPAT